MTAIYVWVLVIGAYGNNTAPVISQPVVDLASCERMQKAVGLGHTRSSQCVEVAIAVTKK
jgi:hypothetical protein